MKKVFFYFIFFSIGFYNLSIHAQISCAELAEYVKSQDVGTTYYSPNSSAIKRVTFYEITDDNYKTYYFAIVVFTSSDKEYIYQVSSNTQLYYSMHYIDSAGKAFWKYIQPHNKNLGCGPDF